MRSSPTKRIFAAVLLGAHIVAGTPTISLTTDVASTASTPLRTASGARAAEARGPGQTLVQHALAAAASTSAAPPTPEPAVPAPPGVVMHDSESGSGSGSGLPPDDSVATIVTEERGNMTTTITIPSGRHPAPIGMGTAPSSSTSPTVPAAAVPPPPVPPTPIHPSGVFTPTSSATQGYIPYPPPQSAVNGPPAVGPSPPIIAAPRPHDPQVPPPDLPLPAAHDRPGCDVVWDTTREPSCASSLPAFLSQARPAVFPSLQAADRHAVVEGLCSTHCGQVYTQQLLSPLSHGHRPHRDACLLPSSPPLPTHVPNANANTNANTNANATAGRGGAPLDPADPLPEPRGPTNGPTQHHHRRLPSVALPTTAAAAAEPSEGLGGSSNRHHLRGLGSPAEDPSGPRVPAVPADRYPDRYPGLRLGCTREEEGGGRYCALLGADAGSGECTFYLSCCFGELLARDASLSADSQAMHAIERACPGSAAYQAARCGSGGGQGKKGLGKHD